MLRTGALAAAYWTIASHDRAFAASPPPPKAPTPAVLNRFPEMLQRYFAGRVREAEARSDATRAALRTREDAEAYVRTVREKIRDSFAPFPEKTPLNPKVTGVVERDPYNIEKIIFESRPGFYVTANLYVPKGKKFPAPGVVGSCGHSANGKAAETYQSFAQGLARQGYIVLIYDPIGQGERLQYPDAKLKSTVGVGVKEHLHAGNQQILVGESMASWRAWDGIRALDYLLGRPEVDPRHVGITGNSGGGTMTTWLCGVEQRWTMGAPSCFVTTFRRNFENELPADAEQYPPRAIALGLDHADFLAALAPKPVLIVAQEKDFFDVRGAREAHARLRQLYRLLGHEDRIGLYVGPGPHGYAKDGREAMYRWFNGATGISDAQSEPELTIEKDEALQCTKTGQVVELGGRTVFSFTRDKAKALAGERPAQTDAQTLATTVRALLKMPQAKGDPGARVLRPLPSRGYPRRHATPYAVCTEPGIEAIVYRLADERLESFPPPDQRRALLYISHVSSDAELRSEPLIRDLITAEPEATLYACDLRGTGESQPNTCGIDTFYDRYGNDYFYAGYSLMLDHPFPGQRTLDVLRVIDWLGTIGHADVHLVARGRGAIPATFAALLSPRVARVTLKNAPASYGEIAMTEDYAWPLSALVPGALEKFDLPDCYRALESKGLRLIEPWGAKADPGT
ncbi:MAG TPA: prolyl oligopeptidase family serine peptidase [Verrucomicrobiae bacterium]|nr:prolyl oligopeptidase family serine peptidase [Verrucomicrobiae bacterium]